MGVLGVVVTILLVLVSLALIGIILIQRGRGGGLAGVFGGSGVEQAFGTHATTLAQKATVVLGILFLVLTVALGIIYGRSGAPAREEKPAPPAQGQPAPAQPPESK